MMIIAILKLYTLNSIKYNMLYNDDNIVGNVTFTFTQMFGVIMC